MLDLNVYVADECSKFVNYDALSYYLILKLSVVNCVMHFSSLNKTDYHTTFRSKHVSSLLSNRTYHESMWANEISPKTHQFWVSGALSTYKLLQHVNNFPSGQSYQFIRYIQLLLFYKFWYYVTCIKDHETNRASPEYCPLKR